MTYRTSRFRRPPELTGVAFRGSDAVAAGILSPRQLRSSPWVRIFHDVYLDGGELLSHNVDHGARCRAAALILPSGAAITGRSAAYLHGVQLTAPDDLVEVIAPSHQRFGPVQGLRIYTGDIDDADLTTGLECPVATPQRAAMDAARRLDLLEAVTLLDALGHADKLTQRELLDRLPEKRPRSFGFTRAAQAILLMDARAESPQESRLRLKLTRSGLAPPAVQHSIWDGPRFIARVDFAWPEEHLAVEYDGVWHAESAQLAKDRRRLNRLLTSGWDVIHVTNDMLYGGYAQLVEQIKLVLNSAASLKNSANSRSFSGKTSLRDPFLRRFP
ncbi:MAG: endonuclease domain-containing protein [Mycobacteriales bacterium]